MHANTWAGLRPSTPVEPALMRPTTRASRALFFEVSAAAHAPASLSARSASLAAVFMDYRYCGAAAVLLRGNSGTLRHSALPENNSASPPQQRRVHSPGWLAGDEAALLLRKFLITFLTPGEGRRLHTAIKESIYP